MKHMLAALAILAFCGSVGADSLILKGGKKVDWKTIRDKGNSYEVELQDGSVQIVQKKDVERFEVSDVQPVLAGAAISFSGKTKTLDLLSAVNPKRDAVFGVVKAGGGALLVRSEIDAPTIVRISTKFPEEYDFSFVVERKSEVGNFYVGLPSGDRSFMLEFDLERGSMSHLTGGPTRRGAALEKGRPYSVLVQVRREAVVVSVDKKEFLVHNASPARLHLPPSHQLPNGEIGAFFGTQRIYGHPEHASFSISRLAVTFQP